MFSSKRFSAVDLGGQDRLQFFLRVVRENKELWGLYADGWAETVDDDRKKGFVVFPDQEHAQLCATDKWKRYTPKSIKLSSFLERFVEKLAKQKYTIAVFPTPFDGAVQVDPLTIRSELL
ncbi:DUF2750 domain-containing protein [Blastopirellula sp. JC732]|uniref:DUF2750 domain-containing protein n=1 Tax=Blastopirellula sediminis TaxID=2894196 RepID=A0A9X1SJ72_9BACT|nr:DUF2750 domain-containing protein [Blastopirellula sediminis]MCC9605114.1 DUF2750 domain-containing protein [Blastopirellula sediminis]MCC9631586.1 DUF2750 domain-containing protein [Blastopirellula sediminis]